jgi:hypothetical protein
MAIKRFPARCIRPLVILGTSACDSISIFLEAGSGSLGFRFVSFFGGGEQMSVLTDVYRIPYYTEKLNRQQWKKKS